MRRKIITTVVAIVAMLGLGVGPAAAVPPNTFIDETFEEEFFWPAAFNPCGVDATVHRKVSVRVAEYFDKDGNFVKGIAHERGTTTVTTEFGQTVDRWTLTSILDEGAETITTTGNVWNVHSADGGPVLVNDSGRLVEDVWTGEVLAVNGPHDAWFGEFERLCEVLEP